MHIEHRLPGSQISDLVHLHSFVSYPPAMSRCSTRVLPPSVSNGFLFHYEQDLTSGSEIHKRKGCSHVNQAYVLTPGKQDFMYNFSGATSFFRVQLQPGRLHQLLEIPLYQLKSKQISAVNLLGKEMDILCRQIIYAPDNETRQKVVEEYFQRKKKENIFSANHLEEIFKYLNEETGHVTVAQLCTCTGFSERNLERLFRKYIGLTPCRYLSIRRLNRVLIQLHKHPFHKLSDIAFECGYSDQPHFNRSFRKWMGLSPKAYLANIRRPFSGEQSIWMDGEVLVKQ